MAVFTFLTGSVFCSLSPVSVEAATKLRYFWAVVPDYEHGTAQSFLVEDSVNQSFKTREAKLMQMKGIGSTTQGLGLSFKDGAVVRDTSGESGYINVTSVYTWPSFDNVNATTAELNYATRITDELVTNFNQAFLLIQAGDMNKDLLKPATFFEEATEMANAAQTAANTKGSGDGVYGTASYTFTYAGTKDDKVMLTLKVRGKNLNESVDVVFRTPKGYHEGQELSRIHEDSKITLDKVPAYLDWTHIVFQMYKNAEAGNTAADISNYYDDNVITRTLSSLISNLLNSLGSMLGLYPFHELMLNIGTRGVSYYYGITPRSWFSGVQILYWFSLVMMIFVLAFSIVKILISRSLSTFNPAMRVSMMNSIMTLAITIILLLLFVPLFQLMCLINDSLVGVLSSMVSNPEDFQGAFSASSGILGALIVNGIFLFILVKINVAYIVRSLTVLILFATAPLCISTLAITGGNRSVFDAWMKELIANIFMQTFHAMLFVLYMTAFRFTRLRLIEQVVIVFSFLPLVNWFRDTIINLGSKTDKLSDRPSGALSTAIGLAAAAPLMINTSAMVRKLTGNSPEGETIMGNEAMKNLFGYKSKQQSSMENRSSFMDKPKAQDGINGVAKDSATGMSIASNFVSGTKKPLSTKEDYAKHLKSVESDIFNRSGEMAAGRPLAKQMSNSERLVKTAGRAAGAAANIGRGALLTGMQIGIDGNGGNSRFVRMTSMDAYNDAFNDAAAPILHGVEASRYDSVLADHSNVFSTDSEGSMIQEVSNDPSVLGINEFDFEGRDLDAVGLKDFYHSTDDYGERSVTESFHPDTLGYDAINDVNVQKNLSQMSEQWGDALHVSYSDEYDRGLVPQEDGSFRYASNEISKDKSLSEATAKASNITFSGTMFKDTAVKQTKVMNLKGDVVAYNYHYSGHSLPPDVIKMANDTRKSG